MRQCDRQESAIDQEVIVRTAFITCRSTVSQSARQLKRYDFKGDWRKIGATVFASSSG